MALFYLLSVFTTFGLNFRSVLAVNFMYKPNSRCEQNVIYSDFYINKQYSFYVFLNLYVDLQS